MSASVETIERDQIQALVFGGLGKLTHAVYWLLRVDQPAAARAYLLGLCDRLTTAAQLRASEVKAPEVPVPLERAIQIAFTKPGLEALELSGDVIDTFAREFKEGMDDDVRSDSLGDRGDNDPSHWRWGHRAGAPVHAVLLLYAPGVEALQALCDAERAAMGRGFHEPVEKTTQLHTRAKEHFGWRDGISTPIEEKVGDKGPLWTYPIALGEFVLGYKNEYRSEHDTYTESPTVALAADPGGILDDTADHTRRDLGRNGTYLVFREMTQDVMGFWEYVEDQARVEGEDPVETAVALGSKMVGRWPNGVPLMVSPEPDDAESFDNEFGYRSDEAGLKCPLGSHIRRANPRDHLAIDRGPQDSVEMVRKHQMIRRGRPFGAPVVKSLRPREILARRGERDGVDRGLHFICLVAHIGKQFEFVQRAWLNSANFLGLFKDGDPIVAARRTKDEPNTNDEFTCPASPVRKKYKGMPAFTRLVGGGYFFMPGKKALRFIAQP